MSVPATKYFWRAFPIAVAIVFAYWTVLVKLSSDWWYDENYSHGLLIPFIIGYILWLQRDKFATVPIRPSMIWGGLGVVAGLLGLWAGVAGAELYTQRLSLVLVLVGTVVYFWGFRLLQLVLVPFALLLLSIPIPAIVFNKIAFPLQLFASQCAVWSMRVLGIPVLRQGNVIELKPLNSIGTKKLEVVEACSGIRSLLSLTFLSLVYGYFFEKKNWVRVVLFFSTIPIAIVANGSRVTVTALFTQIKAELAEGFFHEAQGWVIFMVALVFLIVWHQLLIRTTDYVAARRGH